MQKIVVDGKNALVFVLRETDERFVYIPVNNIHRVDYERLKKLESSKPKNADLLELMKDKKCDNGRNYLDMYDSLIQVAQKTDRTNVRIHKPDESESELEKRLLKEEEDALLSKPSDDGETVTVYEYEKDGKKKQWSGQGRAPNPIKEHLDNGGDLEDFAVKIAK